MPVSGYASAYQRDDVLSATPLRLTLLVINGALSRLERARRAAEQNKPVEYRSEVNRARALIAELAGALDHARGGAIAKQLEALYEFMLMRLLLPSATPDVVGLGHADELIRKIKDGFEHVLASGIEKP